jgi:septal ring factor EnvC (AmiA/AmiB activator)
MIPSVKTFISSLTLASLLAAAGCSKPPLEVDPEVEKLEKKLHSLQQEVKKIETDIQNADNDPALKVKLQEDFKLTESRTSRIEHELKKKKPVTEEPSAAGGHGESKPAQSGHH